MNVIPEPSVSIWWIIANSNVQLAYHCKNIFRLLCRENILEMNLGRYKGSPREGHSSWVSSMQVRTRG